MPTNYPRPTSAFIGASWAALFIGALSYLIGLWNATIGLGEKGYYFILILFGLFAVVSLQKTVRDKQEGIRVTNIYYGLAWTAVIAALSLMAIGLWNATFTLSEKGFYGMAYTLSLFAATAVQKNIRDIEAIDNIEREGNAVPQDSATSSSSFPH
jgi:uncharacterized membrane protein YiaA